MDALNIEKVGPGAWYLIHTIAAHAKSEKEIEAVHVVLSMISNWFFCQKCRKHFKDNYQKFPPPKVNKHNELFIWTVEMHNKVNVENGKPVVGYREALDYYVGKDSTCSGDCGAKKGSSLPVSELINSVLTGGDKTKFDTIKRSRL
jgi:hypothetical protein